MTKIDKYEEINKFVLFGASACINGVVALLKEKNKEVLFLVDNDKKKEGTFINNYEVKSIDSLKSLDKDIAIIIASAYQKEIYIQLLEMNIKNEIFPYIDNLMYNVYNEAKDFEYDLSILKYFSNQASKKYLESIIKFRKSLNILDIKPFKDIQAQYIHPNIKYEKIDGAIIDIGAYDGDSMKTFVKYCPNLSKVYSIEPQSNNFEVLQNNINNLGYEDKVKAIKYAISDIDDEEVFIDFEEDLSSTAQVLKTTNSKNFVLTKTLDNLYKNEKVDFIKMDIEGFEMNALTGAKEIIKNQKPTLALSAYHKNKDIYDFIKFVKSLNNDYKLYCYHHPQTHHEIEYYFVSKKLHKD